MWHKLYIQNSCNTICPRNMVCFRHAIVNSLQQVITRIIISCKSVVESVGTQRYIMEHSLM